MELNEIYENLMDEGMNTVQAMRVKDKLEKVFLKALREKVKKEGNYQWLWQTGDY